VDYRPESVKNRPSSLVIPTPLNRESSHFDRILALAELLEHFRQQRRSAALPIQSSRRSQRHDRVLESVQFGVTLAEKLKCFEVRIFSSALRKGFCGLRQCTAFHQGSSLVVEFTAH
jgi:hypothetical protein